MKLTDNTILITGATSGIGRALAETFHKLGNRVIITGRRTDLLVEITANHPGMTGITLDLTDGAAVARFGETIALDFPDLNVLIANAGVSRPENLADGKWSAETAETIVQTNILGVLRITAAALPVLQTRPNATIMATSSALAFVPRTDFPAYCASKAFLHSWLISLRHQLRHIPVEILELSPPYVQTELTGSAQASDPCAMQLPDYIAAVMALLAQQNHPEGEILLPADHARRRAERDGTFETIFAAMNPN